MHSRQLPNKRSKHMQKTYIIFRLKSLQLLNFFIGCTIRPFHIIIKGHLNTQTSYFIKRKNY